MHTLNSWILAPVDAGRTNLTERPLYAAYGKTQTDSLTHERQRGTTIKPAVVSFLPDIGDSPVSVNRHGTPRRRGLIAAQVPDGIAGSGMTAVRAAGPLAQIKRTDVPRQKAQGTHG